MRSSGLPVAAKTASRQVCPHLDSTTSDCVDNMRSPFTSVGLGAPGGGPSLSRTLTADATLGPGDGTAPRLPSSALSRAPQPLRRRH